jgi:flagellar basal-body rod protein FlgC
MSNAFSLIGIPASGMRVYRTWLDAIADNVSNINTISSTDRAAYQERFIVARAAQGGGVIVDGARFGDPNGRLIYDPNHPLADVNGMVRAPDMDLTDQMTSMIIAQRAYQANVTVFERARDAYLRALEIGK